MVTLEVVTEAATEVVLLSQEVVVGIEVLSQMGDLFEASKQALRNNTNINNLVKNKVLLLMEDQIINKITLTNNKTPMLMWLSQSSSSGGAREEDVVQTSAKAVVVMSMKAVAEEVVASVEED